MRERERESSTWAASGLAMAPVTWLTYMSDEDHRTSHHQLAR